MTRYEPMGTNSAVANALHSGGKRHNKIEATSFEQPPMPKLISRKQAIEVARRLVEKYEKLDDDDRINVADATSDILTPRILLTPEMDEDDPAYTHAGI